MATVTQCSVDTNSQFQNDVKLVRALKHLLDPDDPGVVACLIGLPHDVNLHQDLFATRLPPPPLLQHLSSELRTRGLFSAFLDDGELSPGYTKSVAEDRGKVIENVTLYQTAIT